MFLTGPRELARAGLMVVGNSFARGEASVYHVTKTGFERKAELLAAPPPGSAAAPSSLIGSSVFAAFLIAVACLPPARSSSYSCAIIASMRSFSFILGQMRPPFWPFSSSGFSTPESTTTPVVFSPPIRL